MTRLVGYARTSTAEQEAGLAAQIRDLVDSRCDIVFNEHASSVGERSEFDAALADLRPGDTLVVCKLDRLARSILNLWEIVEKLETLGCGLRILNLGGGVVDTKSATGKLMLTIFAGFAQFEREIMLERQREGIAKARKDGKYRGSKPRAVLKGRQVKEMLDKGWPMTRIARELDISRASAYRSLSH